MSEVSSDADHEAASADQRHADGLVEPTLSSTPYAEYEAMQPPKLRGESDLDTSIDEAVSAETYVDDSPAEDLPQRGDAGDAIELPDLNVPQADVTSSSSHVIALNSTELSIVEWGKLIEKMGVQGQAKQLLMHCQMADVKPGLVRLLMANQHNVLHSTEAVAEIEAAVTEYYGQATALKLSFVDDVIDTPSGLLQKVNAQQKEMAKQAIADDPMVKYLQSHFQAVILDESVEPLGQIGLNQL